MGILSIYPIFRVKQVFEVQTTWYALLGAMTTEGALKKSRASIRISLQSSDYLLIHQLSLRLLLHCRICYRLPLKSDVKPVGQRSQMAGISAESGFCPVGIWLLWSTFCMLWPFWCWSACCALNKVAPRLGCFSLVERAQYDPMTTQVVVPVLLTYSTLHMRSERSRWREKRGPLGHPSQGLWIEERQYDGHNLLKM